MSLIIKDGIKYASGTNLVELTQAQYDQLTSAQKNNGNFYLISDAPCSAFSLSNMEDVTISSSPSGKVLYNNGVNWIDSALKNLISKKSTSTASAITVAANTIDTKTFTVNDAVFNMVVGVAITNTTNFALVQCVFWDENVLSLRVRNLANTSDSYQATIYYI